MMSALISKTCYNVIFISCLFVFFAYLFYKCFMFLKILLNILFSLLKHCFQINQFMTRICYEKVR